MTPHTSKLRSENGFAAMLILALVPALFGGALVVLFSMNYMKMNARHMHICRTAHLETQNKVGSLLKQLIKLNPKALALRKEQANADESAAIAMTTGGTGMAAAAAMQVVVRSKRAAIDLQQRQLIMQSNRLLSQGYTSMQETLRRAVEQDLKSLKPFIRSSFKMGKNSIPKLAVRPDIPDMAPVYNTVPDFEDQQALAHQWQYKMAVANFWKGFLQGEQTYERSCAVTLSEKDNSWEAKIHRVKSWSKWPW